MSDVDQPLSHRVQSILVFHVVLVLLVPCSPGTPGTPVSVCRRSDK